MRKGFTLIELLIIIIICGVVVLSVFNYTQIDNSKRISELPAPEMTPAANIHFFESGDTMYKINGFDTTVINVKEPMVDYSAFDNDSLGY